MTYDEALTYIHSARHGGPDLAGMRRMLDLLGGPDRRLRIVHVAGTNGKGSTCAYIDSVLRAAGYRTGLFTSPFVTRFNERIRLGGRDIPDEDLARVTDEVKAVLDAEGYAPAEFELVTIIGLTYFARQGCDFAVLEVGMGGVHDATNVIETSELSVFTAIGLDHTSYLGDTEEKIAAVKAGIIKRNGWALAYRDFGGSIAKEARAQGADFEEMDFSGLNVTYCGLDGCVFDYGGLAGLRIPLAGAYQPMNAALAVRACRILAGMGYGITDEDIRTGLMNTGWQGRFQLVRREPDFIIDGGHNPQAVRATADSLRRHYPGRRFTFVMGVMADKDVGGILDALMPLAERFVCVAPEVPRAMAPERLAELIRSRGGDAVTAASVGEGARIAIGLAGPEGVVCALGSLYILEEARQAALLVKCTVNL